MSFWECLSFMWDRGLRPSQVAIGLVLIYGPEGPLGIYPLDFIISSTFRWDRGPLVFIGSVLRSKDLGASGHLFLVFVHFPYSLRGLFWPWPLLGGQLSCGLSLFRTQCLRASISYFFIPLDSQV